MATEEGDIPHRWDVNTELLRVGELVGVLVRSGSCAELKTEAAARRLDRMEREKDGTDDAEHEADLHEALEDQSKVVKLIVNKWFIDKGFGFGKTTTGDIDGISDVQRELTIHRLLCHCTAAAPTWEKLSM